VSRFVFKFGETFGSHEDDEKPKKVKVKGPRFKEHRPMLVMDEPEDKPSSMDDPNANMEIETVDKSHIEVAKDVVEEFDADNPNLVKAKLELLDKIDKSPLDKAEKAQCIDKVTAADEEEITKVENEFNELLTGGAFEIE
jgi:hypothetical protein